VSHTYASLLVSDQKFPASWLKRSAKTVEISPIYTGIGPLRAKRPNENSVAGRLICSQDCAKETPDTGSPRMRMGWGDE